jgi:hypothetical protein
VVAPAVAAFAIDGLPAWRFRRHGVAVILY